MTEVAMGQLLDGKHVSKDTKNNALLSAQRALLINPGQLSVYVHLRWKRSWNFLSRHLFQCLMFTVNCLYTCTWNFVLGKLGNWCSLVSSVHCQTELEAESERVQALHKIETRYLTWLMSAEGTCRKQLLWSKQTFICRPENLCKVLNNINLVKFSLPGNSL